MKLVDLDPRWLMRDGKRVGFSFVSPTDKRWRQACLVVAMKMSDQLEMYQEQLGDDGVQPCKQTFAWTVAGGIDAATFETMTVTPSLDGSPGGLWHGHITTGEIVGGI